LATCTKIQTENSGKIANAESLKNVTREKSTDMICLEVKDLAIKSCIKISKK